jgi:signal transduction histidine kinase
MPIARFSEEIAFRSRRFRHLAILRLVIAIAYLTLEVMFNPAGTRSFKVLISIVFMVYGSLIFAYRSQSELRNFAVSIQFADLILTVIMVLLSDTGQAALPLLMFYFLLTEASLLHGAREVLIISAVSIVFYAAWLASDEARRFEFSYSSFMFLLVVGGALTYYFSRQAVRVENRVAELLRDTTGQSEAEIAPAIESALGELCNWMRCSSAILALWNEDIGYVAICRYPGAGVAGESAPAKFDASREWACFEGERMDFYSNDVSLVDKEGKRIERSFDLHPYVIQKFEMYNGLGGGLFAGTKPIGRLLLMNSIGHIRRSHWKKLQDAAPYFRDAVRHLLIIKRTEHEAYEREHGRIANDLHDGPLQSMISFEMRLEIIRRLLERSPEVAARELEALQQFSRKLVSEMRTFVHRMRPLEGGEAYLMASTRRLVNGFQKESGVSVTFLGGENGDVQLPGKLGTEVLQVVREALHNVYKHAQATHVLFSVEQKSHALQISVQDNGQGFRFGGKYSLEELDLFRLGPRSIRQRVRALGGDMSIESSPGQGSSLRIQVPLS